MEERKNKLKTFWENHKWDIVEVVVIIAGCITSGVLSVKLNDLAHERGIQRTMADGTMQIVKVETGEVIHDYEKAGEYLFEHYGLK